MELRRFVRLIFSLGVVCLSTFALRAQATVAGSVVAEDGTPVARAGLMAHRKGSAQRFKAITDAKGGFTLTGLLAGEYEVCVRSGVASLLDPCAWRLQTADFQVIKGQTALTDVRVTLARGYPLVVRVDESPSIVASRTDTTKDRGAGLVVGVTTPKGFFQDAPVVSRDATGHNRVVYVVAKQQVVLHVVGARFSLGDSAGKAIPLNSAKIPLVHPGTSDALTVGFQVK